METCEADAVANRFSEADLHMIKITALKEPDAVDLQPRRSYELQTYNMAKSHRTMA